MERIRQLVRMKRELESVLKRLRLVLIAECPRGFVFVEDCELHNECLMNGGQIEGCERHAECCAAYLELNSE